MRDLVVKPLPEGAVPGAAPFGVPMGGIAAGYSEDSDGAPPPGASGGTARRGEPVHPPSYSALLDLVTSSVAPTTWDDVGGRGSASVYDGLLVVSQTSKVQSQIERFLEQLRAAKAGAKKPGTEEKPVAPPRG